MPPWTWRSRRCAQVQELHQARVEVQQGGSLPAMSLAFNARHVLDALGLGPVEGDVTLRLSGPTTPAILQPMDGGAYQAIIVTLRV